MRDQICFGLAEPRLFDKACSRQKVDHGGDADRHQPSDRHSPFVPTGHCLLPNASQCRSLAVFFGKQEPAIDGNGKNLLGVRGSRGSDPQLLRLTMDGRDRPRALRIVPVPRLDLPDLARIGAGARCAGQARARFTRRSRSETHRRRHRRDRAQLCRACRGGVYAKMHMWFCSSVSQQSDCSSYRTPGENWASVAETNRSSANGEFATTSGGT
jgi:hypothetical protein